MKRNEDVLPVARRSGLGRRGVGEKAVSVLGENQMLIRRRKRRDLTKNGRMEEILLVSMSEEEFPKLGRRRRWGSKGCKERAGIRLKRKQGDLRSLPFSRGLT